MNCTGNTRSVRGVKVILRTVRREGYREYNLKNHRLRALWCGRPFRHVVLLMFYHLQSPHTTLINTVSTVYWCYLVCFLASYSTLYDTCSSPTHCKSNIVKYRSSLSSNTLSQRISHFPFSKDPPYTSLPWETLAYPATRQCSTPAYIVV